ncbi:MAG: DUF86 domain-containing protein [Bacillota bacterium]
MIEKDKLRDKISFIEKNLRRLGKIGQTPLAGFTEESISYHAAVRLLQVSIEAVIDIGNHIVARERLGVPKTYGEIFELLAQAGITSPEFTAIGRKMVKFRNRAVHLYADLDEKEVYSILQNNLNDFSQFISFIVKHYLAEDNSAPDQAPPQPAQKDKHPPKGAPARRPEGSPNRKTRAPYSQDNTTSLPSTPDRSSQI